MSRVAALTVVVFASVVVVAADRTAALQRTADAAVNRTSKELNDPEPKTTGRKYSAAAVAAAADDYGTFSTLTSDLVVEGSPSTAPPPPPPSSGVKAYPSLTTSAPAFVTRGRFIRNPFYFNKEDQEVEFEEDDHHAELILNPAIPKWNRYNTNHRQLNKYGPTPIEADITVDEDGSAGYGSTFDFGGGGGGYDSGGGYSWNPGSGAGGGGGGGGGWSGAGGPSSDPMSGWFSEPVPQAARPVPIIAEIRRPAAASSHLHQLQHKHLSVDLTKVGLLALLKLAAAKLKALGFIKAMLLVLFKVKLLLLLLAAKSLMLMKLVKLALLVPALLSLLTLPMLFSRLSQLGSMLSGNTPVLVPNNGADTTGGDSTTTKRRRTLDPLDAFDPGMAYFRQVARTEKCVERIACRVAAARQPSLTLIWLNWAVSPISSFIPSKKIRSFVSTFTEVTNFRLDNVYSSLLPSNWTEWCNDHYTCGDKEKNVK